MSYETRQRVIDALRQRAVRDRDREQAVHAVSNALAETVEGFAEWLVDNNSGHFTRSDLCADAARYLAERKK
jgi:hypothetical protein